MRVRKVLGLLCLMTSQTLKCPPRPVQHGVGSNWPGVQSSPTAVSASVRADCGGRLFTAKLSVVVRYLPHQMFNHLLPDDAILLARQFRDCLRDRVDDFICFRGIDFA